MAWEQTLILVKPDGVRRHLVGEIIARFEHKGMRVAALRNLRFSADLVAKHYIDHVNKDYYENLKTFIMSGTAVAIVIEGDYAIQVARSMIGATRFYEAAPGSIRGDYAISVIENLVHGSDSPEAAAREIPLFFSPDEIHSPEDYQ